VSIRFINTPDALESSCAEIVEALKVDPRLAIDTEFVGERSYEPSLELLQAATADGEIYLIDVHALDGRLDALADILLDDEVLKLVHAASQDAAILRSHLGRPPTPLFDTQVAAAYVGMQLQLGYGAIVRSMLKIDLAKDESFADWTRRPIRQSMLDYAANDVAYLHALHDKLKEKLDRLGRARWVDEACAHLVANAEEVPAPHELWRKVGGRGSLDAKQLGVLRELCIWRDEEAQRRDRPRRSVVKDEVLVEIARRRPQNARALLELRSVPPSMGERTAADLVDRVRAGLNSPLDEEREQGEFSSLDEHGSALYELLSAVVRVRSIEAEIAPTLLANADALRRVAATRRSDASNPLFQGWREELIGRYLREALEGHLSVTWDPKTEELALKKTTTAEPPPKALRRKRATAG
jgi:ribonuclease D